VEGGGRRGRGVMKGAVVAGGGGRVREKGEIKGSGRREEEREVGERGYRGKRVAQGLGG